MQIYDLNDLNNEWTDSEQMMMFTMSNGNIYNEMMDDMYNRMMIIFTMRYNKWNDNDIYNEAMKVFTMKLWWYLQVKCIHDDFE